MQRLSSLLVSSPSLVKRALWGLVLWGSCIAPSLAAARAAERSHDITPQDYATVSHITDVAFSPDSRTVAFTESRWVEDLDTRNKEIWLVDVATSKLRRLTFNPKADSSPQWGPAGRHLYFTSSRKREGEKHPPHDGTSQVWRVRLPGGAIEPVTRVKGGIKAYRISEDGRFLYYTKATEQVIDDPWKAMRRAHRDLRYGHGVVAFDSLRRLDLETWRTEKLVDEKRNIGEFAVSPDGRHIAMITTPNDQLITNEGWSAVEIYDASTGKTSRLDETLYRTDVPSPYGWLDRLEFSDDGEKLAFRVSFDGYPSEILVAHFPSSRPGDRSAGAIGSTGEGTPSVTRLTRSGEIAVSGPFLWAPGLHDLVLAAEDHARLRLYRIGEITRQGQGRTECLTPGDEVIHAFDLARDGRRIAALRGGLNHMPDLFLLAAKPDQSPRRLTNINPQVDHWKLPQIRIVRWQSMDGTPVEGVLELPPGYRPGTPLPTLVAIHGGPTAATYYELRYWIYGHTIFAARGWAVLDVNYRGSTGYGDEFLTALVGNKNNLDVQDILSGVDHLVREGIADPKRLGVMGWSNGGYLTNCLITTTDRFKAASSGAGVLDTVMQWEIEDTPGHVVNFSGGLPWQRAEKMQESSPLYNLQRVSTPTIIHVGEKDERVPAQHARALHRALHYYLHVPTELVVYPGEPHSLGKLSHRRTKLEWDIAWMDRYVLGKGVEE